MNGGGGMEKMKEKEKEEKECDSIGHRPLRGRCPKSVFEENPLRTGRSRGDQRRPKAWAAAVEARRLLKGSTGHLGFELINAGWYTAGLWSEDVAYQF